MPTYEYACQNCGIIEVFQSMSEDALKKCPECNSKKIERLISGGGGFIFKGDGFWETDYNRSDDYKEKAKKEQATSDDTKGQNNKDKGGKEKPKPKTETLKKLASNKKNKPKKDT